MPSDVTRVLHASSESNGGRNRTTNFDLEGGQSLPNKVTGNYPQRERLV